MANNQGTRRAVGPVSRFYRRALFGGVALLLAGIGLGLGGGLLFGEPEDRGGQGSLTREEAAERQRAEYAAREAEVRHAAELRAARLRTAERAASADLALAHAFRASDSLPPQTQRSAVARPVAAERLPDWRRYAAPVPDHPADAPKLAIVIDDLGVNRAAAREAVSLPAPMTFSFMTYARGPQATADKARAAGHEVMLHIPMQPHSDTVDPGPQVLRTDHDERELTARLAWGLSKLSGYVGVNNHMGSAFTTHEPGMRVVLQAMKRRGLLFLDSRTDADSLGESLARELGVPHAARDIFLDNERDVPAIRRQLDRAEALARRNGSAIAIGHPYPETYEALHGWVAEARARGVVLVPVSAVAGDQERDGRDLAKVAE